MWAPTRSRRNQTDSRSRSRTQRRAPSILDSTAVRTLRQVAGGARRGLAGALSFTLLGIGVLTLALPTTVAYALAALTFGLAGLAASRVVSRWRD